MTRSLLVLVMLLVGSYARSAYAQSAESESSAESATERARAHFKLGVDLYRERNYRAALIEFKRAYKAAPHYKLLYNLGQASLELQEDSSAIEYFTTYLSEGQDDIAPERRQEVEDTLVRLKARLATVTVATNQQGAEIYLDGSMVGTSPLTEPLKLSVGRRTIAARKHGFSPVEHVLDVAAGDHVQIDLEFKEKPAALEAKLPSQQNEFGPLRDEDTSLSAAAWMGITTGAVAAGAVTMTILTALAQNSYDDEVRGLTTAKALQKLREEAKTKALITDVLWGATLASAVITTVLLVVDGGAEREPPRENLTAIRVDWNPTSLGVRGQF
jgi:tetratricopeptide (TPR) repeat protein